MSQQEIERRRTEEVRGKIYGKTRYTDANTDARWIPSQIA